MNIPAVIAMSQVLTFSFSLSAVPINIPSRHVLADSRLKRITRTLLMPVDSKMAKSPENTNTKSMNFQSG